VTRTLEEGDGIKPRVSPRTRGIDAEVTRTLEEGDGQSISVFDLK